MEEAGKEVGSSRSQRDETLSNILATWDVVRISFLTCCLIDELIENVA